MPIRLTGMNSGLDTESLISELVKAKSTKLDTLKGDQKKQQWKQDAWKELNSKVYSFYTSTLSNMRYKGDYLKKTTKASSDAISVVTGGSAPNVTQSMTVDKMAKSGYLTGGNISEGANKYTAATKLTDAKDAGGLGLTVGEKISVTKGDGTTSELEITADTTIKDVVEHFKNAGLNANFDEKNQRFYISSKNTGAANDFTVGGSDSALSALGLAIPAEGETPTAKSAVKIDGQDAEITLNGAKYTSTTNNFEINGLTISVNRETDEKISLNTTEDTDGIYNMVKNFLSEYNKIINEMDKLYNAASSKDYKMLTDDERNAMSDKEVEEWDSKIKDSLLRRDSTLSTVANAMKMVMSQSLDINGKSYALSNFGIATLGYFNSPENEKNAYHIDGDKDDEKTGSNEDRLRALIATDPDTVSSFFSQLSRNLYDKVGDMMKSTTMSSAFTLYNDKEMKTEYNDYSTKISDQQNRITEFEDRWYSKFSKMEAAMSKMQSKTAAVSSLFGGQ